MKKRIFLAAGILLMTVLSGCLFLSACNTKEHEHIYDEWEVTREPTCTLEGVRARVCDCGDFQMESIPASHKFGEYQTVTAATCETDGVEKRVCSLCNAEEQRTLPAPGHEFLSEPVVFQAATCTTDGLKKGYCLRCEQDVYPVIPAFGHLVETADVTVLATCEADGHTEGFCTHCGERVATVLPAFGHAFGSWATVTAATCTVDGEENHICGVCGKTESRAISQAHILNPAGICEVCGESYYTPGLEYHAVAGGMAVGGIGSATDTEIIIPAYYNGSPVVAVKPYAFLSNRSIVSVKTSGTLTEVGTMAFFGCANLSVIDLSDATVKIGTYAFGETAYVNGQAKGPVYMNKVLYVFKAEAGTDMSFEDDYVFQIREGTIAVAPYAFNDFLNLREVDIPASVMDITSAFHCCARLKTVRFAAGSQITEIGTAAFYQAHSLREINIPATVQTICASAFYNAVQMETLVLPNSVHTIENNAFAGLAKLKNLTLSTGLLMIGDGAFSGAEALTEIRIPAAVLSIGDGAFSGGKKLQSAYFTAPVPPAIGKEIFKNCPLNMFVYVPAANFSAYEAVLGSYNTTSN